MGRRWLQGMVTRLRKELKEPEVVEGAGKRVLAQLTELQNSYEDLRENLSSAPKNLPTEREVSTEVSQ